jgi:hypothetical protein
MTDFDEETEEKVPVVPFEDLTMKEQLQLFDRMKGKLLQYWNWLLEERKATSTDLATMARFFGQQGWTLNPAQIPKELKDYLKDTPVFTDDDEAHVIDIATRRQG